MIPVVKPYLPSRKRLDAYLDRIYESAWLSNNGPLVQEFTQRLETHLGVTNLLLLGNGSLALQIAYAALGIKKVGAKVLTSPFSFIATSSTLKWEGIEPVFSDIDADTFCLDPVQVTHSDAAAYDAIVPVHVYGNACNVEAFESIAREADTKLLYDGAHAFGVQYKSESLLSYGDACTLSFHATKLFHSVEGGAIIFRDRRTLERAQRLINFGMDENKTVVDLGINAKMNEFQAAMGLAVLDEIDHIMEQRERVWQSYHKALSGQLRFQKRAAEVSNNFAYFPVLFESQKDLLSAMDKLEAESIFPRRYFYPSLDELSIFDQQASQPIAKSISERILCLPIFSEMTNGDVEKISRLLLENL